MPFIKTRQAAAKLGISPSSLLVRAERGDVPGAHRTIGNRGHWRFELNAFDQYCAEIFAGRNPVAAKASRFATQYEDVSTAHLSAARARARQLKAKLRLER